MKNFYLKALYYVWIIYSSSSIVLILLTFYVSNKDLILKSLPQCERVKLAGTHCFLCGCTRAFVEISSYNIQKAILLNKLSIYIYFIFIINTLIFALNFTYRSFKKHEND